MQDGVADSSPGKTKGAITSRKGGDGSGACSAPFYVVACERLVRECWGGTYIYGVG